jgi:predicted RNA-binding Zn ribbon-like protein
VPAEVLVDIRANAGPHELDEVADQARGLREWLRGFVRKHMGRPLTPAVLSELEPLDTLLERDETFSQIRHRCDEAGAHLEFRMVRRWRSPESLLLPIGEAIGRFICEENFTNVRACEGTNCTRMFVDHTPRRARRWCSMAICGNRAKQSMYRKRLEEKADRRVDIRLRKPIPAKERL